MTLLGDGRERETEDIEGRKKKIGGDYAESIWELNVTNIGSAFGASRRETDCGSKYYSGARSALSCRVGRQRWGGRADGWLLEQVYL